MSQVTALLIALLTLSADPLGPGDHFRSIKVGEDARGYHVHIPPNYDREKPAPVVLIFHGAVMNGPMMLLFSGLNEKADQAGFIAVYPNGTGAAQLFLVWNAGGTGRILDDKRPDDVAYVDALLDDLATVVNVDPNRVYATGMSNGGMMCYRLAAELSGRIAAIAPVAGTMAVKNCNPKRPVPVMHFHGTKDKLVRFEGPRVKLSGLALYKSVDETIKTWVEKNGCPDEPGVVELPDTADDGTAVTRKTFGPGKDGAEVVLFVIDGGGHTWPGRRPPIKYLGKSTKDISANDLIWEFFQKHPMKHPRPKTKLPE